MWPFRKAQGLTGQVRLSSQEDKLRARLSEAGLRHGDTARVDIHSVGTVPSRSFMGISRRRTEIRFCNIEPITVREIVGRGDNKKLPQRAKVLGFQVPDLGYYSILGALVRPNGRNVVECDERTRIVKRELAQV